MDANDDDEKLDPRIQSELEKLNAATDGINHLETEFGEAQALFQQMMQDATFQLKNLNQELGKCVEKSRPYYEAMKQARHGHNQLHNAALKFEQAQSRHFNSKKRVSEAECRSTTAAGKLDPALQEMLNQATIEVMEAATASNKAWEIHRAASLEFEEKQKCVQVLFKKFNKQIMKSRPYFDLKYKWNKQLEIQKQRLEKIQEGIGHSKIAYSDTLHCLEIISDDIHRSRQEKARSFHLGQRGQGVGAEQNDNFSIPHDKSMDRIRRVSLDQLLEEAQDSISSYDDDDDSSSVATSSDQVSLSDDAIMTGQHRRPSANIPSICVNENCNIDTDDLIQNNGEGTTNNYVNTNQEESSNVTDSDVVLNKALQKVSLVEDTERSIKENVEQIDSSYDVITSHSIKPMSPDALDMLPELDITDSGRRLLNELNANRRARSMTDLSFSSSSGVKGQLVDISMRSESTDNTEGSETQLRAYERIRCQSMPQNPRKSSSFSIGVKPQGYNSPRDTPESRKRTIANFAALTMTGLLQSGFPQDEGGKSGSEGGRSGSEGGRSGGEGED